MSSSDSSSSNSSLSEDTILSNDFVVATSDSEMDTSSAESEVFENIEFIESESDIFMEESSSERENESSTEQNESSSVQSGYETSNQDDLSLGVNVDETYQTWNDSSVDFAPNSPEDINAAGDRLNENIHLESNVICAICLNNMVSREPQSLPCGHVFCNICIRRCLEERIKTCPTCKASFNSRNLRALYL